MAAVTRIFSQTFWKIDAVYGINICIQYVDHKKNRKSGLVVYQGDKLLIWRKQVKDGRNDPNISPNFLKNWCSLGINTCIQYVEHQMNWKSGFVDIRMTWMSIMDEYQPCAAPPPPPARAGGRNRFDMQFNAETRRRLAQLRYPLVG